MKQGRQIFHCIFICFKLWLDLKKGAKVRCTIITRLYLGSSLVKSFLSDCACATEGSSHFNSLFATIFGHAWPSAGFCRCAELLYYTACYSTMWLVIFFFFFFSFYSCCSHLEHRACAKRFVSIQFLNLRQ
jgi:hypothetical protein